jgi:hypothetical protein
MLKYSVGLDVSSKDIHACISAIDAEQKVKVISSKVINNTSKGFEILITWIEKNRKHKDLPLVIGMEATGIYHEVWSLILNVGCNKKIHFKIKKICDNYFSLRSQFCSYYPVTKILIRKFCQ